jgi:hypothetical protein
MVTTNQNVSSQHHIEDTSNINTVNLFLDNGQQHQVTVSHMLNNKWHNKLWQHKSAHILSKLTPHNSI